MPGLPWMGGLLQPISVGIRWVLSCPVITIQYCQSNSPLLYSVIPTPRLHSSHSKVSLLYLYRLLCRTVTFQAYLRDYLSSAMCARVRVVSIYAALDILVWDSQNSNTRSAFAYHANYQFQCWALHLCSSNKQSHIWRFINREFQDASQLCGKSGFLEGRSLQRLHACYKISYC